MSWRRSIPSVQLDKVFPLTNQGLESTYGLCKTLASDV